MDVKIKLAVRDWDYLAPLALGDIKPDRFELEVHRVNTLPSLGTEIHYEAVELSFSQYAQAVARGDDSFIGLPHFLMRAFRHRCIITAKDSTTNCIEDLAGKRIGVTGWQDSGNTWTRALLARAGVAIDDVRWYAGRLTSSHPIVDRLGRYARANRIEAAPGERPLVELLLAGELDAVFTPFMPPNFFSADSRLRFMLNDFRSAERIYFNEVGYVPGIHMLGIKSATLKAFPWLGQALSEVLLRDLGGVVWQIDKVRR